MPPRIRVGGRGQVNAGRGTAVRDAFGDAPRAPMVQNHRQKDDVLGRFVKVTPAAFEEEYDPEAAARQLMKVMRSFRLVVVPENFRVEFAVSLLWGSVLEWWELHEEYHDNDNLTWNEFKRLFRENYIPEAQKREMIAQFSRLVYGDMTVVEYHARFINLSRYDPSAVANSISRYVRFREGLRRNIISQLASFPFT